MKAMMNLSTEKFNFYKKNWKLIIHLVFRTYYFGTNNMWWYGPSMFGYPWYKKIWMIITVRPFIENLKLIWFRSVACHFMTDEQKKLVGWYRKPGDFSKPWWTYL